jgi:DNA-binding CsgD family transcriptional regulator/tetratricopeptide (TPR) repeat protein
MVSGAKTVGQRGLGLLEREHECGRIDSLLRGVGAGCGAVLLIEGPAGIGKTELAGALGREATAEGMLVLSARGAELERDYPLGLARQLLERTLRDLPAGERRDLGEGAGAAGAAALGSELSTAAAVGMDAGFAVVHGLYWLVADLAARRPLALIVDDAHWGDALSLRFLAYLAPRIAELPALLVIVGRDAAIASQAMLAGVAADEAVEVMRPRELSVLACALMAEDLLAAAPDEQFVVACHTATAGNPLLLRRLLAALAAEGIAPTALQVEQIEKIGSQALGGVIRRTLLGLPAAAGRVARAVAVLGSGTQVRHAAVLAEIDTDQAAKGCGSLVGANVLAASERLEFVHPLLESAIYENIPPTERLAAHARAARVLSDADCPVDAIAAQLLRCEPVGEEWVVRRLRQAARDAGSRAVPEIAARYLRRALAEPGAWGEAELLYELGQAESRTADPDAVEHLEAAFGLATDGELSVSSAIELALAHAYVGRFPDAAEALDRASNRVGRSDPVLRLSLEAGAILPAQRDRRTAGVAHQRLASIRRRIHDTPNAPAHAYAALAVDALAGNEPASQVLVHVERVLASSQPGALPASYLGATGLVLIAAEDYGRARAVADEALMAKRQAGDLLAVTTASDLRALIHYRRGDITAAQADAGAAIETAQILPQGVFALFGRAVLIDALIERGALAEATVISEAVADLPEARDSVHSVHLQHSRGRLLAAKGEHERAAEMLRRSGEAFSQLGWISPAIACWRSDTALVLRALGEREEAIALSAEEVKLARAFGRPRALGIALRAYGLIAGGARGLSSLQDGVAVLEPSDARLEYARALVDLGGALRRDNQRVRARVPLTEGARIATRCGAPALAERARQELLASGARPRRFGPELRDELTASERRVADLAATGMTNREIAQALFITLRTVETHLTHLYRKLDIDSRSALHGALADATATG